MTRFSWSPDAARIFALCDDKPVAYHPALARIFGIETSLIFVQALWKQSEAEARGATWWACRHDELADRLGFSPDQLRRHIKPLLDSVTLDRRAILRARVTGFGRSRATEYQLDTALALGYVSAQIAPRRAPYRSNAHYDSGQTPTMAPPKEKKKEGESVGVSSRARAGEPPHPAVSAFWEASGQRFWPQGGLIPAIIREVGEDPERVALWRAILERRLARGQMLMDVDQAFAYLRAGTLPAAARLDADRPRRDTELDMAAVIREAAEL